LWYYCKCYTIWTRIWGTHYNRDIKHYTSPSKNICKWGYCTGFILSRRWNLWSKL